SRNTADNTRYSKYREKRYFPYPIVRQHLHKTNLLLTFGVSNVENYYDNIVWFKRNRKNMERYPSQKNAD
ncbi:hypothetical protein, partial [Aequorivita viscosa]|uniref:hypothetical protein n=1 Tax=Aequorivita viscosa TaxID=797419 RepID=UPI001C43017C